MVRDRMGADFHPCFDEVAHLIVREHHAFRKGGSAAISDQLCALGS
jgi:hypothetical protein